MKEALLYHRLNGQVVCDVWVGASICPPLSIPSKGEAIKFGKDF